jgi:DNA topoisomerase-1
VNAYLKEAGGGAFTAKDFRTWNGTVAALESLGQCEPCASERHGKHQVAEVMRVVSRRLGNTPAVCRASYVHPEVVAAYLEGRLPELRNAPDPDERRDAAPERGLSPIERCVLQVLREGRERAQAEAA